MKKLMIAAAAAAMIGGAQAAVRAEYDFVAYLTTTAGAQGTDVLTPDSGYFGVNATGDTMYYNDSTYFQKSGRDQTVIDTGTAGTAGFVKREWTTEAAAKYPHLTWITAKSVGGVPFPTLHIINEDAATGLPIVNAAEAELLAYLRNTYNNTSYGYWCGYAEWYTKVEAQCFRVASGDTIITKVYLNSNNCCSRTAWGDRAFTTTTAGTTKAITFGNVADWTAPRGTTGWQYQSTSVNGMMNCFGAQSAENAIYLETYARVENVQTTNGLLPFQGWLAGQGNVYSAAGVNIFIPWTISGSIVGTTRTPVCPDCCVRPLPPAIAFDCFDVGNAAQAVGAGRDTAAFGTFYLQVANTEIIPD